MLKINRTHIHNAHSPVTTRHTTVPNECKFITYTTRIGWNVCAGGEYAHDALVSSRYSIRCGFDIRRAHASTSTTTKMRTVLYPNQLNEQTNWQK